MIVARSYLSCDERLNQGVRNKLNSATFLIYRVIFKSHSKNDFFLTIIRNDENRQPPLFKIHQEAGMYLVTCTKIHVPLTVSDLDDDDDEDIY